MKKTIVRILSLTMAMITMLVVAAMPVSAASISFQKTINGSTYSDTSMLCNWSVTYTPVEDSNRELYETVNGSADLDIGPSGLESYTKYLVAAMGAEYTDEAVIYYRAYYVNIGYGYANQEFTTRNRGGTYMIDQTRLVKFFHTWHLLTYEWSDSMDRMKEEVVDNFLYQQAKYYLSLNT